MYTGSYSAARRRLGIEAVNQVADRIFSYLKPDSPEAMPGLGRQALLMDGSSLTLPATPELLKAYPPSRNRHGVSHWPVMKFVVATGCRIIAHAVTCAVYTPKAAR